MYAFKDEKAVTFDTFGTLIPDASGNNIKEFELLVADDAPTGAFRSIGQFQTQNVRLLRTQGWQDFKFPSVTAKYLKVKLLSNWGGAGYSSYEFRVFGTLQE